LAGLVVVLGVLFLSERFMWFPFNEYKGCTVLIASATAAGGLVLLLLWLVVAAVLRRRSKLNLRSLLVSMTICGIVFAWYGREASKARRQRDVMEALRAKGFTVDYKYEFIDPLFDTQPANTETPVPDWVVKRLGVDFFSDVTSVDENSSGDFDDSDAELLKGLPGLKALDLYHTQITDAGVAHLKNLCNLRILIVAETRVTDAGLAHLKGLTRLDHLDLRTCFKKPFGGERAFSTSSRSSQYISQPPSFPSASRSLLRVFDGDSSRQMCVPRSNVSVARRILSRLLVVAPSAR
jgi:hypothetical protein